jgi:hypothetical protein
VEDPSATNLVSDPHWRWQWQSVEASVEEDGRWVITKYGSSVWPSGQCRQWNIAMCVISSAVLGWKRVLVRHVRHHGTGSVETSRFRVQDATTAEYRIASGKRRSRACRLHPSVTTDVFGGHSLFERLPTVSENN